MLCAVYYDPRGLFTATATSSTLSNIRPSPVKRAVSIISHDPEECKRRGIQQYCQRCRAGVTVTIGEEEVQNAASASNSHMPLHSFDSEMSHVGIAHVATADGLPIVESAASYSASTSVTNTASCGGSSTKISGEKRSRVHEWPATAFCSSQTPLDVLWQTQKMPTTTISRTCSAFRLGTQQHDAIGFSQAPSQNVLLRNHRYGDWIEQVPAASVPSQHTQTPTLAQERSMPSAIQVDRATSFSLAYSSCTGSSNDMAADSDACHINILQEAPSVIFKKTSPGPTATAFIDSSFTGRMTLPLSASILTAQVASVAKLRAPHAQLIELAQSSLAGDSRCCRYPLSQDELFKNFSWTSRIFQACIPPLQ
jgi:hypothetical protein